MNLIDENEFCFRWVTDFPMFEYSEEDKRWVAEHHPFTAPRDEDVQYLLILQKYMLRPMTWF